MTDFLSQLTYTIRPGTERILSWADRERGYIDVRSAQFAAGAGYVRGNLCRCKDVLLGSGRDLISRADTAISASPGEIRFNYRSDELALSLLLEQSALWLSFSSSCALLLPKTDTPWCYDTRIVEGKTIHIVKRDAKKASVPAKKAAGEEPLLSGEAVAIASIEPIEIKVLHGSESLHSTGITKIPEGYELCLLKKSSPGTINDGTGKSAQTKVYIAWGENSADKAADLLVQDGKALHQQKIEQFFSSFTFRSGNEVFDRALAWAAFSGWTMVTREYGLGIWAGLPWFRDNWGRDTFIALPGILLVTGQFAEAKEIIATFAERQDKDPASPNYGRIPNRWRNPQDVIYNTVDGTPWFIREVWEYVEYTGDTAFALAMKGVIDRALEADLGRCDEYGFLTHGPADTWMDARIRGKEPWSERGNRAVEVQALFYTALRCGEKIARLAGDSAREDLYRTRASALKKQFLAHFWFPEHGRLADRLLDPASPGVGSSAEPDLRSRPNALLAVTVLAILPQEEALLPEEIQRQVLKDVYRELVYPYGVASLSQEDPYFHGHHDGSPFYHKDAAYHNGTIWLWNSGFVLEALLRFGRSREALKLQEELCRQVLEDGAVGTLSENSHALLAPDGLPTHSGTFSQAWSVSELVRVGMQSWLGIRFSLTEKRVFIAPHPIPTAATNQAGPSAQVDSAIQTAALHFLSGAAAFGRGNRLHVQFDEGETGFHLTLYWDRVDPGDPETLDAECTVPYQKELISWKTKLEGGKTYRFSWDRDKKILAKTHVLRSGERNNEISRGLSQDPAAVTSEETLAFKSEPNHSLTEQWEAASPRLPTFNRPSREKNYLEKQILSGLYNRGPIESLRAWYDSKEFARSYHTDEELGAICTPYYTDFKVWAPTAAEVHLCVWRTGAPSTDAPFSDEPLEVHRMYRQDKGVWHIRLSGEYHGLYYTYRLRIHSLERETIDPYAKSAGLNGNRGMILDPRRLEPEGWQNWLPPALQSANDAIIWETHIRDLTSHRSWQGPEELRCTYLGAAWSSPGTAGSGFDYIRSLGVTHVQILPIFDFVSVDEGRVREPEYQSLPQNGAFNWGYDPGNYMAPEGSYATNPADGANRVLELRSLVHALGKAGIGVIMDVVYNHVPDYRRSALEACVPGYYFRGRRDSGAGDDTASERYMFRKYMIDSLRWWLTTYKLSGFRFDLMGLHDVETMQSIATELKKVKPDLLLYGEGWNMYGGSRGKRGLSMASQLNIHLLPDYGMFNDAFRDGVKGSVFDAASPGWIHDGRYAESVKFGLVGAVHHHDVHNHEVSGTARPQPWTEQSASSINYLEVHDNLTLYDKLHLVESYREPAYYGRLQRLGLTLLLTSQGIPVLHAGMEFLRTKEVPDAWIAQGGIDKCVTDPATGRQFCHDSYKAGDLLNGLDWERAAREGATVNYVRFLIRLRKEQPGLRLEHGNAIRKAISFLKETEGLLVWQIDERATGVGPSVLLIAANSRPEQAQISLPHGTWQLLADSAAAATWEAGTGPVIDQSLAIPSKGALVLLK
ncbi:type I pullulanase [Gracilinema caldarium]|uniref:type I pullulanase n=1 Tax=Gracilinema caldarium TaxID=215591 RepID=UPI0026EFA567|nr:type I pullulanase [Gracilinema caldarium]